MLGSPSLVGRWPAKPVAARPRGFESRPQRSSLGGNEMPKKRKNTPIALVTKKGAFVQNKEGEFERVDNFLKENKARDRFLLALVKGKVLQLKNGILRRLKTK